MWRLVLLSVVACSSRDPDPPPPPPPTRPPGPHDDEVFRERPKPSAPVPPPAPPTPSGRARATWSRVATVDDCWYFSGPEGRDTKLTGPVGLERDGDKVTMRFGDAVFTGTLDGDKVSVRRTTTHDFGGAWTVAEKIDGTYHEGAIEADYRYTECEHGTTCPNHCTIHAKLHLAR